MEKDQLNRHLREADFHALYHIKNDVLARLPCGVRARPGRSIFDSNEVARAEATELAEWGGVTVVYVYWNMDRSEEIQLHRDLQHLVEGKAILDFFSMWELKDFINA